MPLQLPVPAEPMKLDPESIHMGTCLGALFLGFSVATDNLTNLSLLNG